MTDAERLAALRETYSSGGAFTIIMAEDVIWLLDLVAERDRLPGEPTSVMNWRLQQERKWTTEPPTVPGWYWAKDKHDDDITSAPAGPRRRRSGCRRHSG